MIFDIETVWMNLERDYREDGKGIYRRIDLPREGAIDLAVLSPGRRRAILVELPSGEGKNLRIPRWKGMNSRVVSMEGFKAEAQYLCLSVENHENESIFTSVCIDIIRNLESAGMETILDDLNLCFDRWSHFFDKVGNDGLSAERQRGLFGELYFIKETVRGGVPPERAMKTWLGCLGNEHDFILDGRAVEVKTTMTKEPRRFTVNSERQLDDSDLESLHLYVLTLHQVNGSGMTLPGMIESIRELIRADLGASTAFENALVSSGYRDEDGPKYGGEYSIRAIESFKVVDGFPRVVNLPPGVGNLVYSVSVASCRQFEIPTTKMIAGFKGKDENDT